MLTVNVYCRCFPKGSAPDLVPGKGRNDRWTNFSPAIAELYSDDHEKIEARKKEIAESEWSRCAELADRRGGPDDSVLGRNAVKDHGLQYVRRLGVLKVES